MAGRRAQPRFDPYAILEALEREAVTYILVGAFARVLVGADEITYGVDLTPAARGDNLRRLDLALEAITARRRDGTAPAVQTADYAHEPVVELRTDHGEVKIVPVPERTGATTISAATPNGYRSAAASAPGSPHHACLLYTSPSPRDGLLSRMPSSA